MSIYIYIIFIIYTQHLAKKHNEIHVLPHIGIEPIDKDMEHQPPGTGMAAIFLWPG